MAVRGGVGHRHYVDRDGLIAIWPGAPVRDDKLAQPKNPIARLAPIVRITQPRPRPAVREIAEGDVVVASSQRVVVPCHIIGGHAHRGGQQG